MTMTSALQRSECCSATSAAQLSEHCSATSVFASGMLQGWGLGLAACYLQQEAAQEATIRGGDNVIPVLSLRSQCLKP